MVVFLCMSDVTEKELMIKTGFPDIFRISTRLEKCLKEIEKRIPRTNMQRLTKTIRQRTYLSIQNERAFAMA